MYCDNMLQLICDCCGKEIPVIKKKDALGIEREYLQSGEIMSMHLPHNNLRILGIDVCKDCAHKIDMEVMQWKMDILEQMKR